jgi:hypothetical protein
MGKFRCGCVLETNRRSLDSAGCKKRNLLRSGWQQFCVMKSVMSDTGIMLNVSYQIE